MKKSIILLSAITMVLSICSCQKESRFEYGAKGVSLTATFEEQIDPSATKTYLDNGLVKWSPNDAIKVFYSGDNAYKFDLAEGENAVTARFEYDGDVSGEPQYAIYPYSADASISGSNITFTIPAVQKYVANSFDNGANVAVAQIATSGMQFKNVCGVLRIYLKGNGFVKKLVLTGKTDEKLNGIFTVDASSSIPSASATTTSVDSEKSIILECSEGVVPLTDNAVSFYFVVPVGAFSTSGFEVKAYSVNDLELNVSLVGSNLNVINRSRIRAMDEKTVNGFVLPEGYKNLEYIEANSGDLSEYTLDDYAYIETPCRFLFGDHFYFDYMPMTSISLEDKGYGAGTSTYLNNITGGGRMHDQKLSNYICGQHYDFLTDNMQVVRRSTKVYHRMVEQWSMTASTINCRLVDKTTGEIYRGTFENPRLTTGFDSVTNVFIFRDAGTTYAYPSHSRLYNSYLQRADETYAFILQPALRVSDSKPGVYDLVSGTFLVNQGTGADFTYPTPAE